MSVAYVGLGANLGEPALQLRGAVRALQSKEHMDVRCVSAMYRTAPVGGPPEQPDYVNAVAKLETSLHPRNLLEALQSVEALFGRTREVRWGARTLDLDLLLYDSDTVDDSPDLIVPHPRLHERAFVLVPLAEVAGSVTVPGRGSVAELLRGAPAREREEVVFDQRFWSDA